MFLCEEGLFWAHFIVFTSFSNIPNSKKKKNPQTNLEINLNSEMKGLYNKFFNTMKEESVENTRKWKISKAYARI